MSRALRILATGFGPFLGVPDNPTAELMRRLAAGPPRRGHAEIVTAVLPVEWQAGPAQMLDLLKQHDPDAALLFGAARGASSFRIEQTARNRASNRADAAGKRIAALPAGLPRTLRARLPAMRLALHLQRLGLPATASTDAGGYLCNAVYYIALDHARRNGRPAVCQFVHIPAEIAPAEIDEDGASDRLTWDGLTKGALALIDLLAAEARRAEAHEAAQHA